MRNGKIPTVTIEQAQKNYSKVNTHSNCQTIFHLFRLCFIWIIAFLGANILSLVKLKYICIVVLFYYLQIFLVHEQPSIFSKN